jgi:chorismate mutase
MSEVIQSEVVARDVHATYGYTRTMDHHRADHVQEVLKQANDELRSLLRQRAELVKRIGTIKQTISGLANLFGPDILTADVMELVTERGSKGSHRGFTRLCRLVLMESKVPMSARDVCDQIREKDPDVTSRHKDLMASVTTVLNRLTQYGEAKAVTLQSGRRAWQWVSEGS